MNWDIKTGHEQSYFEFVMQEFAPGLMRLGLQPTEAWYTVYGRGPQILTGAVANDLQTMHQILETDDWRQLRERLLEHVHNFSQKVITASGRFQLEFRSPRVCTPSSAGPSRSSALYTSRSSRTFCVRMNRSASRV